MGITGGQFQRDPISAVPEVQGIVERNGASLRATAYGMLGHGGVRSIYFAPAPITAPRTTVRGGKCGKAECLTFPPLSPEADRLLRSVPISAFFIGG